MKVLMVNTEKDRGGAARMAATLVDSINHDHADISAVLAHCGDAEKNYQFKGYKRNFLYYLNVLQTRFLGSHRIYDFGVSKRFSELATEADVVHLHNLHGYYLDYVGFIESIRDKPIVWTWHDMWGATGRCGVAKDCAGWKSGCSFCPNLNYYPKVWLDNASSEFKVKTELFFGIKNLAIVSPSEWVKEIAIDRGFDENMIHSIPNPVDLSKFLPIDKYKSREKYGLPVSKIIILFVAHNCNDPVKGYRDFEQVVNKTGYIGLVVGVPPVRKNSNIIYLGKLSNIDDLAFAYSASDAFVITSQSDNYPNTVIESMACGTPVFGYNVGGIPSQMPMGWSGLVDYSSIDELSELIVSYISNEATHSDVRSMMRQFAMTNWDKSVVSDKYVSLYNKMISMKA